MPIKMVNTTGENCRVIFDLPHDADVDIENTKAINVDTVLKVRDNQSEFKNHLLKYLKSDTPDEIIERFIQIVQNQNIKDTNAIESAIASSGINRFLKSNLVGTINFASAIATLLTTLSIGL